MTEYLSEFEAGLAFGTGHHESTALCLSLISSLAKRRRFSCVLDLGCGTGVLACIWLFAAAPVKELRFSLPGDPKTFDALHVSDQRSELIRYLTSGVLVRLNRVTDQVQPELAEVWHLSEGGRDNVYHFYISVARQAVHWDPVVLWARNAVGAGFTVVEGVMHVAQPADAISAARARIPRDSWRLGATHAITTLTGSALIALAVAAGAIFRDAAWAAAHVDEDWNMDFWGRDEPALARRAYRFAEMVAATQVLTEVEA